MLACACSSSSSPDAPGVAALAPSTDLIADANADSPGDANSPPSCQSFVAATLSTCEPPPPAGEFPADVAAVLGDKCQTCHKNPPVDHAPFALLTYADTLEPDSLCNGVPIWQAMHYVIQPGSVPHMPFGNAPQLTSAEFATLDGWLTGCAMPAITSEAGPGDD